MKDVRHMYLKQLPLAVVLLLAAASPANAGHQDYGADVVLRLAQHQASAVDFRSPDTRSAGTVARPSAVLVDLRSPDSRDAARGYRPPPPIDVVRVAGPSRFDWRDAGVGAAGAVAMMLFSAGAVLVILRHRRSRFATL